MDCNGSELPKELKSFKKYCKLIFDGPLNQKEEKVKATCILLWIGEEDRRSLTFWNLATKNIYQKIDVIFDKFTT